MPGLELTIKERSVLRRKIQSRLPTVAAAAAVILERGEGRTYRDAGEAAGVSKQYAYQVCKTFLGRGRLSCPPLTEKPGKRPNAKRGGVKA